MAIERISVDEFRKRQGAAPRGTPASSVLPSAPGAAAPTGPEIRLSKLKEPNATELRWRTDHQPQFPAGTSFRYEEVTLRLPCGTLYTPDWSLWTNNTLLAYVEVKGAHIKRDASKEKFKQSVAAWPSLRFLFAQWKGGQWLTLDTQSGNAAGTSK